MLSNFVHSLKEYLLQNYKILLLSIVIFFVSFPALNLYYVPGIDGPLIWVFNYFADGHFQVGKDLLFPHGPLAFLLYPLPMGNNLTVRILISGLLSILVSLSIYKIYFIKKSENYLVPTLLLLILQAVLDIQLLILLLCICQFILYELNSKKAYLLFGLFLAVFNLFIKSYGGILCLTLLFSVVMYDAFFKKNKLLAFTLIAYFFIFFYAIWISLYHSFSGAFNFLRGQYELSSDNSEAVSFYQVNNWWWIGLCFLAIVVLPFFTKDKIARLSFYWLLLPLFGAWKHAMSRGDETHVSGFLSFLFLFCFMIWLLSEENKIGVFLVGIVILSTFTLNMATTAQFNDYSKQKDLALIKPFNLYNLLVYSDSLTSENNRISSLVNQHEKLPTAILQLIHSKTVDIFPWNHSVIAVNNLKWVTRPSIHSYTSYTHWLDKKNAEHYLSGKSAEYVIWQIDQLGGKLNSIDSRYLLNDAPQAILAFYCAYELVYKDSNYLVYKKLPKQLNSYGKLISDSRISKFDTWIDVPEHKANSISRIKLNISKSFTGILKSALYKGESFSIYYELQDCKLLSHKLVPKNAADGLWLNPFILSPETNDIEPSVKKIKIVCWDKRMVTNEFEYVFEEICFEKDADFLQRTFWKKDSTAQN
jgi:hypothetical protein